ncbi:hypothetical protein Ancab_004063, partial [Ancistrocladus abbreviatus]
MALSPKKAETKCNKVGFAKRNASRIRPNKSLQTLVKPREDKADNPGNDAKSAST